MNTSQLATAIYARVSWDRQAPEGTIASQIEDRHARARSDGVTPTAELAFVGLTSSERVDNDFFHSFSTKLPVNCRLTAH